MLFRYLTHPLASVADALEAFDSAWEGTSSGTQCCETVFITVPVTTFDKLCTVPVPALLPCLLNVNRRCIVA
jgi:hypothetical protein